MRQTHFKIIQCLNCVKRMANLHPLPAGRWDRVSRHSAVQHQPGVGQRFVLVGCGQQQMHAFPARQFGLIGGDLPGTRFIGRADVSLRVLR